MNATTTRPAYEWATAMDVKEGDIVISQGYRCRASNVKHYRADEGGMAGDLPYARYTLHSEPDKDYPNRLPGGYEGGCYGGNKRVGVGILRTK